MRAASALLLTFALAIGAGGLRAGEASRDGTDTALQKEMERLYALRTVDTPAAAAGQAFVAAGITYTVRQVLRLPPDGAFQRLVLARA